MSKKKDGRVNLRIDPALKEKMQGYCERKHTTMSELVTRFFVALLDKEKETHEAPQI